MGVVTFTTKDAYRVMLKDYPDVLSVRQMCDILHISTKTGYQMIRKQDIQALKIGRNYRVPKLSILRHLVVKSAKG